jgi:predicted CXXCH cytochrome family protein
LKFRLLLFISIVALFAVPAGLAVADNGPHGGYTATTDACAGCHRSHTAASGKLLLADVPNLCYDCHGSAGTGADTNVVDGVYLARDGVSETPPEGVDTRGLKGGGFVNALMNTDRDAVAVSAPATSSHLVNGSTGIAWGNGAIGSGAGASISLSCTSCHDPHGRASSTHAATYRLLRSVPLSSNASLNVDVTDEVTKTYTVVSATNDYFGEPYAGPGNIVPTPAPGVTPIPASKAQDLSYWCVECHTRYMAPKGSYKTNSGDGTFTYEHRTVTSSTHCLRCHVAHGSPAKMGTLSGSVPWPDHATSPSGDARSSLLRLDNRGVCQGCHNKK